MTTPVQRILRSIERLSEPEKKALTLEIIRRTARADFPPLTDEELTQSAEELFLELDKRESMDA